MASIKGVEVKAIKSFVGEEGICYQGNVYIDGKKAGFWSNDSWGGPDNFDFDTSELVKRAKEYYTEHPQTDDLKFYGKPADEVDFNNLPLKPVDKMFEIDGMFMYDLLNLTLIEKDFKKYAKKGYKVATVIGFHHGSWPIPRLDSDTVYSMSEEVGKAHFKDKLDAYPYAYITTYTADSFKIS